LARHAVPHLIEATLVPLALFYTALWLLGVWGALIAALAWSYLAIGRRLITRKRVPGMLLMGALGLTARTLVAFASGSVFLYFLQPTFTTVVIAGAFLFSLRTGRPMAERLAADFCPLDADVISLPVIKRVFARITLLWALLQFASAALTIGLLVSQPVGIYVASKTVASFAVVGFGVVLSTMWFIKALEHHSASPALPTPAPVAA
jgi:hypothetical protein